MKPSLSRCVCLDLPLTDYSEALKLQYAVSDAKISGALEQDVFILTEHPPVFTLGRRGGLENLTADKSLLTQSGIRVIHTERGGNITYHGPGQIVCYPIIHLKRAGMTVVEFVSCLEDIMIRTAADWGIAAGRRDLNRGVWVGDRKIGSIGITVRRQISFHGFALNICADLKPFEWIHPCGLKGTKMTSFEKELPDRPDMKQVRLTLKKQFGSVFNTELEAACPTCFYPEVFINKTIKSL